MTSRLGKAALRYADAGWPVFPLLPRDKRPATKNGFKDASTDREQVNAWWASTPEFNIGLPTGIGFDVLDLDGPEALDSLSEIDNTTRTSDLELILDGPTVSTGKGWHVYYQVTGLGNKAGLVPNVDWRGNGGYVVAPPSVHPNGNLYEWVPAHDDPYSGWRAPLHTVPSWLMLLLDPPKQPRPQVPVIQKTDGTAEHRYTRAALANQITKLASAVPGVRNNMLNEAAYVLGTMVGSHHLDRTEVEQALTDAALHVGMSGREVEATIASGLNSGEQDPWKGIPV